MIRVVLECLSDGALLSCKAQGHSMFAPAGQDIVCAAASVLLRTALSVLKDTSGFTVKTDKPKRGMLSFYVDCIQKDGAVGHREILIYTAVFLQKGLSALQAEYPSHLSLQVVCARDCKYVKDGGI